MDSEMINFYYEKFINVKNLESVNPRYQKLLYLCFVIIIVGLVIFGFVPHIFGLSFDSELSMLFLGVACLPLISVLFATLFILYLDRKYKVFKRPYMPYLFIGGYYIIALTMILTAYLTTSLTIVDNMEVLTLSSQWLLIIYGVVFLAYIIFCHKAFLKVFIRYTALYERIKNKNN